MMPSSVGSFAAMEAIKRRHEYVTLEHLLYALLHEGTAAKVVRHCGGDANALLCDVYPCLCSSVVNKTTAKVV